MVVVDDRGRGRLSMPPLAQASAYMIRSCRDTILLRITEARFVIQPPISLHFGRKCLEQTLPQCKAFDFLVIKLESQYQLDQHGGVVLHWESRESEFMLFIDQQAREAKQMTVCPMRLLFDQDFINITNRNPPLCAEIQQMEEAWRNGSHSIREIDRIRQMEEAWRQIAQPREKIIEFDFEALD